MSLCQNSCNNLIVIPNTFLYGISILDFFGSSIGLIVKMDSSLMAILTKIMVRIEIFQDLKRKIKIKRIRRKKRKRKIRKIKRIENIMKHSRIKDNCNLMAQMKSDCWVMLSHCSKKMRRGILTIQVADLVSVTPKGIRKIVREMRNIDKKSLNLI